MNVLATFPGRYGDLIWALPTVRALSRRLDQPVDLQIAGEFASIVPLLGAQLYLGRIYADPAWSLTPPDEWHAPVPTWVDTPYDYIFHLGYRGWPQRALPFETLDNLHVSWPVGWARIEDRDLDLQTPWITVLGPGAPCEVAVGFTEAWFELKYGLMLCLERRFDDRYPRLVLTPPGSRWQTEPLPGTLSVLAGSWLDQARAIRNADRFLGDCSALHVLSVALGTPAIICEPMEARWNPIFYPLGMDGPQVRVVKGNDDKPTFDARHVGDTLEQRLQQIKEIS